jgi:K+-sensing histidine kinase KdpD
MHTPVGRDGPTTPDTIPPPPETRAAARSEAAGGTDAEVARLVHEARELDALKCGVTALLIHEVRGALCVLAGFVDMAAEDLQGFLDPATREVLASTQDQMERITGLLQQLGDFAQTTPPSADLDRIRIDELLDELLAHLAIQLGPRFPDVVLEIEPEAAACVVHGGLVGVALRALIGSLVRLDTSPVQLVLRARRRDDRLELQVHHPRLQIDARTMAGFAQAAATPDPYAGGLVLGQWIAWRAVALVGGELVVRGEPGEGAVVFLRTPVRAGT